jgi:hypothetical protein
MKSTHHYQERGKERKENGTRTLSEKKAAGRLLTFPATSIVHIHSIDSISLGSSVRPFASPARKRSRSKEHFSLLLPVCVQQHPKTRRVKEK